MGGALYGLWRFALAGSLALVLFTGCSITTTRHANRLTLGLAEATIACDWHQTRSAAEKGWHDRYEANPIMGRAPSTSTVDMYMAGAALATIAVGQILPERARAFLYGAVAIVEAKTIADNVGTTVGLCGFAGAPVR